MQCALLAIKDHSKLYFNNKKLKIILGLLLNAALSDEIKTIKMKTSFFFLFIMDINKLV